MEPIIARMIRTNAVCFSDPDISARFMIRTPRHTRSSVARISLGKTTSTARHGPTESLVRVLLLLLAEANGGQKAAASRRAHGTARPSRSYNIDHESQDLLYSKVLVRTPA